jgi:hypothetical protein
MSAICLAVNIKLQTTTLCNLHWEQISKFVLGLSDFMYNKIVDWGSFNCIKMSSKIILQTSFKECFSGHSE